MAKDVLKKDAARNSQPPDTAPVGIEGAYGNLPEKYSKSYEESGHMESAERPAKPGGVLEEQKADHGRNYPGRDLPPSQQVTQAQCQPAGTAKKCADTQNDSNRHEMNQRVAEKGQP